MTHAPPYGIIHRLAPCIALFCNPHQWDIYTIFMTSHTPSDMMTFRRGPAPVRIPAGDRRPEAIDSSVLFYPTLAQIPLSTNF